MLWNSHSGTKWDIGRRKPEWKPTDVIYRLLVPLVIKENEN